METTEIKEMNLRLTKGLCKILFSFYIFTQSQNEFVAAENRK